MSHLVRLLVAGVASVIVVSSAVAQSPAHAAETAAVLDVVDRFMRAISTDDVAALQALRLEGALNIVESPDGSGGTRITRRTFDAASYRTGTYLERYWDPVVHVRGSLAIVWTPYEFLMDGTLSHCGIDAFEMVKQEGQWRIGTIMWTVERDGCEQLRPSDPATMRPRP